MSKLELLKLAKYLDENGSYSVADDLDKDFVKIAQNTNFKFPVPGLPLGFEASDYFIANKIPPLKTSGYYPPSYEKNKLNIPAPPNMEFSPRGNLQPKGTGDQWYASKLFEEFKPYSSDKAFHTDMSANKYALSLGKPTGNYEFSPKGYLQSKGWGEASAAMKVFKSFPQWKPQNLSEEAQNILIKRNKIEAPKEKSGQNVPEKSEMFEIVLDETDPNFKKHQDKQKKVEQNTSDPFDKGWSK